MADPLLQAGGTVHVRTSKAFSAREDFIVSLDGRGRVKIGYILGDFPKWFLPNTHAAGLEIDLQCYELQRNAPDKEIVAELGGPQRAETDLAAVFWLMERRANGQRGPLANNGFGNTFYVRDNAGELRTVNVHWCDDSWGVLATRIQPQTAWPIRDLVFSPVASNLPVSR